MGIIPIAMSLNGLRSWKRHPTNKKSLRELGFFQAVKDALTALTSPATGLTIAYTALYAGDQRSNEEDSEFNLARKAYGNLERQARWHRRLVYLLSVMAILLSLFAAWEATKAALGKSLLQILEPLRAQQAIINKDKLDLEIHLDKDAQTKQASQLKDGKADGTLFSVCDRSILLAAMITDGEKILGKPPHDKRIYSTPQERDLCGRDFVLQKNLELAHYELQRYNYFWPDMPDGFYKIVGRLVGRAIADSTDFLGGPFDPTAAISSCGKDKGCDDAEIITYPTVQVISNYTLSFIFGVIGSLLYVLLEHYTSIRLNTLSPRDRSLAYLRLILGVVVAACVSLLVSSYAGPSEPASGTGLSGPINLVRSLTLSASAITFLAGFGAEAVFTLLQGLVTRVFALPK